MNWEFYLFIHKDLRDAGIKRENQAMTHYLMFGKNEGRITHPLDLNFYKNKYPELSNLETLEEAIQHYESIGIQKGLLCNEYMNNHLLDGIIFINLESRKDRRKSIENELKYFCKPYTRLEASYHEKGYIGCAQSHIRAIELAKEKGWKNALIIEDDFIFTTNKFIVMDKINTILQNLRNWNMILLTGNGARKHFISDPYARTLGLSRVTNSQTTSTYIINNTYYDVLLNNFRESHNFLIEGNNVRQYAIDIYWKQLQQKDLWLAFTDFVGKQKEDYSDIEKRYVNYNA